MATLTQRLANFNHYPTQICTVTRPERHRELLTITQPVIARGQGCSYGDASLNDNILSTERLNRLLEFDRHHGILTAEAGVTLKEILDVIVPRGWFLPVTPGTQYVSLGGCVATDAHGKNHPHAGSLGQHILGLEIILAHGESVHCSPQQHADIFWATIGGMGLTGVISAIVLQLLPIASRYMRVTHQATANLEQALAFLTNTTEPYSIIWLDTFATGKNLGRGVLMTAHHAERIELPETLQLQPFTGAPQKSLAMPCYAPNWLLNKNTAKIFNRFYYQKQIKKSAPFITDYGNYFYPLDRIRHWNYLYGKRGFVQYQCALPYATASAALRQLLSYLQTTRYPSFLATLKRFGTAGSGLLSFPIPGFTLALDLPLIDTELFTVLNKLDEIVVAHSGRVYLAKDARLSAAMFRAMYPRYAEWLAVKNKWDPEHIFCSSLSKRLEI
jgi:decaprenylphospho-beta-D-ribofuranose 2-oxidase